MISRTMRAAFSDETTLIVNLSHPLIHDDRHSIVLLANHQPIPCRIIEEQTDHQLVLKVEQPFDLSCAYRLVIESFKTCAVDTSVALTFPDFETRYDATSHRLGAIYTPTSTTFSVWVPLAHDVDLMLYEAGKFLSLMKMQRLDHGVYTITLQGNLDGQHYRYRIHHALHTVEVIDPYQIGLSRNSEYSVVLNPACWQTIALQHDSLPPLKKKTSAIIYETHLRDLTKDQQTTIQHKGTFLGAIEKGATHLISGLPVGFDYLIQLGITHLQLLPVHDYATVHEYDVDNTYNWGYDPYHYVALEGSLAANIEDPYARIVEFRQLVSHYHKAGIRINVDVVYNHVYAFQNSVLETIMPGYYFRRLNDGTMSNGSFCGNDVASEKAMVRHLILTSVHTLFHEFGVDGLRFDLMGIIDQKTMEAIRDIASRFPHHIMLYGEGWNMPTHLTNEVKCITERSSALPYLSFFNDAFRNLVKGGNFEHDLHVKGYATGKSDDLMTLYQTLLGSANPNVAPYKVQRIDQSISYIECHDNGTFMDKLTVIYPQEDHAFYARLIRFGFGLVLISQGIPFLHMAQEVGGSKKGDHNSYRSGDAINQFDYALTSIYAENVQALQALIQLRKKYSHFQFDEVITAKDVTLIEHHPLLVYALHQNDQPNLYVAINPSFSTHPLPEILNKTQLIYDGSQQVASLVPEHIAPMTILLSLG